MNHRIASGGAASIVLLAFISLSGVSRAAGPLPEWAAKQTDGGPVRVAVPAPKDAKFAHLAWPKAVRAADGSIVVAYLAGAYHGGGGSPAVSYSSDGGKTFSSPNILREFGPGKDFANSGNLGLAVADDGAIVLLAMAHTGNKANHIFGWRSADQGRTWQPVETPTLGPNKTGSVTSIVRVPGAGLMATGHYRKGSRPHEQGIWVATSVDSGKTWGEPTTVNDVDGGEPVLVHAPKAAPGGGNRLLIFIRSRTISAARQYIAVSDDMAKTWKTDESQIGVEKKGTLAHPFAMMNPSKDGELVILTAERPQPGRVWLWRGDPKTLEFKRERVVLEFPKIPDDKNTDYGYTWIVPTEKDCGLMFYYHGQTKGRSEIWVAEVSY